VADKENLYQIIVDICLRDSRYKPDAYEFIIQALHFTQVRLKRGGHVTGFELCQGLRDYAIEQYGPMAKTVLNHWGISKTDDFGNIVFNMIDKKILSKTETDSLADFQDVYDFKVIFSNILRDGFRKDKDT